MHLTLDSNNLPSKGEYYEARINARSLGAMFYTARNVEDTLDYKMPKNNIDALASRPVVAYVALQFRHPPGPRCIEHQPSGGSGSGILRSHDPKRA